MKYEILEERIKKELELKKKILEVNKEKRQEFLIPGTLESKETPGGRNREIIRRMAEERTPDKQEIRKKGKRNKEKDKVKYFLELT